MNDEFEFLNDDGEYVRTLGDPFLEPDAGGDEPVETGSGESNASAGSDGPNVDVETDHIVIG